MLSADPRLQVIPSFIYRATRRIAELSRYLVALQLTESWDNPYTETVLRDARYLSHGLRTLRQPGTLTLDQQRYICERLLPMIVESSGEGTFVPPVPVEPVEPTPPTQLPLSLTLDKLTPKIRGLMGGSLTVSGTLNGSVPAGAQLVILRDGLPVSTLPAVNGKYSYIDSMPGSNYTVYVTGTNLRRQASRQVLSPILSGVLPHGATAEQIAGLQAVYPGTTNGVGRFTFTAARKRIYLAVPTQMGLITKITQPNDNDADTTAAFTGSPLTLDFGVEGSDSYTVYENFADFIGSFTLDIHLTAPVAPVPTTQSTVPMIDQGEGMRSYPFSNMQVVNIVHNLGRYVMVDSFDSVGNAVEGDVSRNDLNSLTISFSQPLSGVILLR